MPEIVLMLVVVRGWLNERDMKPILEKSKNKNEPIENIIFVSVGEYV